MKKFIKTFLGKLVETKIRSSRDLEKLKERISADFQISPPSNADLRKAYLEELKTGKVKSSIEAEKWLKAKRMRTASGVATVAVLTKNFPCRGNCLYCPTEKSMPKSYLSNEPAVMRAITVNFDPYQQVQKRLLALELNGHSISKIEIIVMGGTFSHLPEGYRYNFVKECFRACNEYGQSSKFKVQSSKLKVGKEKDIDTIKKELFLEQATNETAEVRIVGLTLETRPDEINEEEIKKFREMGATRVEIGVQSIDDKILKLNKRGHGTKETVIATKLLKNAGFKVSYHLMLGLWGSSPAKDYLGIKKIFIDQRFKPDLVKIYPCTVTKGSQIFNLWKKGRYLPLSNRETEKLIIKIKKIIPHWVRVSRVIRDIPATSIVAGPNISNLRQLVAKKAECRCIRCREIKADDFRGKRLIMRRTDYFASGGREIFLEYTDKQNRKLFSLLRLRISSRFPKNMPELKGSAIIREVHTYGKTLGVGAKSSGETQHLGLGKALLVEAEGISFKEFGKKRVAVIAGVGVREYYAKRGYNPEGTYMVKEKS